MDRLFKEGFAADGEFGQYKEHISSKPSLKTLKRKQRIRKSVAAGQQRSSSISEGHDVITIKKKSEDVLPKAPRKSNLGQFGYTLHEQGYYCAAKTICKIVDPSERTISVAGGTVLEKFGEVKLKTKSKKGRPAVTKTRHMTLVNGSLKFYNTSTDPAVLDIDPPDHLLHEEETIHIQHIRAIKMKDLRQKSFALVYWEEPSGATSHDGFRMTLRRKSSGNGNSDLLAERRKSQRVARKPRLSTVSTASSKSKSGKGSLLKRVRSMSFGNRESQITEFGDDLYDSSDDESEDRSEDHKISGHVKKVVTIKAKTIDEANNWLLYLLVALENQAVVFQSFADILEKDPGMLIEAESLRRHAVDLACLSRGGHSGLANTAREKLGNLLERTDKVEEASLWYRASTEKQEAKKVQVQVRETGVFFYELLQFLEKQGTGNRDPDEEARVLLEEFSQPEIAQKLYERYNNLPVGWEDLLEASAKAGWLEQLHSEIETLKQQKFFLTT